MFKRELIFLTVIVVVAALLSIIPSHAYATAVYPIQGKVINQDLPEIKWEDGEPGDSAYNKIGFLSSNANVSTLKYSHIENPNDAKKNYKEFTKKMLMRTILYYLFLFQNNYR